jgi:hypothetical protein
MGVKTAKTTYYPSLAENIWRNAMKKSILVFVLSGLSVLLFFSCASTDDNPRTDPTLFVFDDSTPTEQLTEVEIRYLGAIKEYNGIAVKWGIWPRGHAIAQYTVKVPAGDTLFNFNVGVRQGDTYYTGENMLFRYNLLPNIKYLLTFMANEGIYGVNVYIYEIGENTPSVNRSLKTTDPHFSAFVPFLNAQGNRKTVLE